MLSIALPHGGAQAVSQVLYDHAALAIPEPRRWVGDDRLALLWTAPGQFLAVGEVAAIQPLAGVLLDNARLIDLSDARVVVRLSGRAARDVLARLVPIDLHPRAMGEGHVASTVAAHIGVQLWQIDGAPIYDIACPVSYTASLLRALQLSGAPAAT